jgi:hypothetical protein
MTKSNVSVLFGATLAVAAGAMYSATGCSSNNGSSGGADSPAGVVIGPPDDHCKASDGGLTIQPIGVCDVIDPTLVPSNAASCTVTFDQDAGTSGANVDAGAALDAGGGYVSPYGPTMYGAAGNDDDCKYYVSWTATPIKENADTYFTVTAIRLADMTPATCAGVRPDVSLSVAVGAPAPRNPSTEIAPGVYKVGPIKFSQAGIWTVRFHLFEECSDDPQDSPHGHAAFFVQVP